ncbi:MAG: RecX family transcriptional regulator [Armatimonadetes bacterium]|nr:RecX family transcriptional regulator [Armatimonadota bacterium]MDW8121772.1 RecX family transcriptional regulator [Armatimonadota bacterium]
MKDGKKTNSPEAGWRYAVRLLTVRARSARELKDRLLERGFSQSVSAQVVRRLKRCGLVNDRELAESVVRWALEDHRPHSRREVEQKLTNLGVDPSLSADVLSVWDEETEVRMAVAYLTKRLGKRRDFSSSEKARAFRAALQKGFSFSSLHDAFRRMGWSIFEDQ